jgi:hypothetical protein
MKFHVIIFTSALYLFFNIESYAQMNVSETDRKFEASVLCGWLFAGNSSGAKIVNGPIYSVSAAYVSNPQVLYELNVNSFYSKIRYDHNGTLNDSSLSYSQTYIMFSIVRAFRTEIPDFVPYLSPTIGFAVVNVKTSGTPFSQTRVAAGIMGGIKVDLNSRIGLKFQVRVQAPLSGFGLGVGIGTGGPSVGIGSYSNGMQFDTSAGLFFRI